MCDASNFAIGTVLGQHIDNRQHVIYYSSRTLMTPNRTIQRLRRNFWLLSLH